MELSNSCDSENVEFWIDHFKSELVGSDILFQIKTYYYSNINRLTSREERIAFAQQVTIWGAECGFDSSRLASYFYLEDQFWDPMLEAIIKLSSA